eukprot:scaffold7340_cov266-Pinguiococcus_pyrenoidosus.AAC.10
MMADESTPRLRASEAGRSSLGVFFTDNAEEASLIPGSETMEVVERPVSLRGMVSRGDSLTANDWYVATPPLRRCPGRSCRCAGTWSPWIEATAFFYEEQAKRRKLRKSRWKIAGDDVMIRERLSLGAEEEKSSVEEPSSTEGLIESLGRLYRRQNNEEDPTYWFQPAEVHSARNRDRMPLRVVRDDPPWSNRVALEAGDLLKVANVWIRLVELCDRNKRCRCASTDKRQQVHTHDDVWTEESGDEPPTCYMCYDNEHTEDNPIIAPCACKGSTKYCHAKCLMNWRAQNVERFSPLVVRMSYSCDSCRICGAKYQMPSTMASDGSVLRLGSEEITAPYMVLQVLTDNTDACKEYAYYVSFAAYSRNSFDSVTLGRCPLSNDLVLTDMAVSMSHLSFQYINGTFSIEDEGSENGTFIAIRKPLQISASKPTIIAAGGQQSGLEVRLRHRVRISHRIRQSLGMLTRSKREKGRINVTARQGKENQLPLERGMSQITLG